MAPNAAIAPRRSYGFADVANFGNCSRSGGRTWEGGRLLERMRIFMIARRTGLSSSRSLSSGSIAIWSIARSRSGPSFKD